MNKESRRQRRAGNQRPLWQLGCVLIVLLGLLAGCAEDGEQSGNPEAGRAVVRVRLGGNSAASGQAVSPGSQALLRQRATGIPPEVTSVVLHVTTGGSDIPGSPFEIPLGTGTTSVEIAANTDHVLTAEARNVRGNTIFEASETVNLPPGADQNVTLTLTAITVTFQVASQFVPAATGGNVQVTDPTSPLNGLRLSIPPGALSQDTTITITEVYNPTDADTGQDLAIQLLQGGTIQTGIIFDLGPDSTSFTSPPEVQVPYDETLVRDLGLDEADLRLTRYNTTSQQWELVPDQGPVDTVLNVIPAHLESFSLYTVGEPPGADLEVSKADAPDPVTAGEDLAYTVTVTNNGPDAAMEIALSDTLPAGVTFDPAGSSPGCGAADGAITCDVGRLAAGENTTVTIATTVDLAASGVLTNTVTVESAQPDPDPSNNSDTADTTVLRPVDLAIVKMDDPDPVLAGADLTYTITITNNSPFDATGVTVTDTLPAGVTFSIAASSPGCTPAGGQVTCMIGALDADASTTVNLVTTVNALTMGIITNTASVAGAEPDPNPDNDTASEDTTVTKEADLSVTKADSADPVTAGEALVYTVTVTNHGPSASSGSTLTDPLPADVSFDAGSSDNRCAAVAGTVTCTLGALAVDASTTVTIAGTVAASAAGSLSNTVTVVGTDTDTDPENDSATETTAVITRADLGVTKSDNPDPVVAGAMLTYTLMVTNHGPSASSGSTLTDTLPDGVSVTAALPESCTAESDGNLTCTLGALAAGASTMVQFTVDVAPDLVGSLTNTVSVQGTDPDPNAANNSATATTDIAQKADLGVTKTDSPDPVVAGAMLTYTVTVTNHGPSASSGSTLTDPLPADVSFDAGPSDDRCAAAAGTVTCTLGALAVDASTTVTIAGTVAASAAGSLSNTVTVVGTEDDPNAANDSATATTEVSVELDLAVIKSDSDDPVVAGAQLTYTLTVTNHGPADAANITVTDTLPAGVSFDEGGSSAGCMLSGGQVTCTIDTLAAGSHVDRVIVVTVDSDTMHALENTVTVSSPDTDTDPENDSATETTAVITRADLGVTKSDNPDPVVAGAMLTYTLTVTNHGPSASSGSTLTDPLPADVSFDAESSDDRCTAAAGTVTCTLGALAVDASTTVTIAGTVAASATGSLSNTVTVVGTDTDTDPENDSATETTAVITRADLGVTKTDSPDPVVAGQSLLYMVTVTNHGPSDSSGSTLTDTLPADVSFDAESSDDRCTAAAGTVTCTLGALAVDASTTVTIAGTVNASAAGSLSNTVTVVGTDPDPNAANDSATATTDIAQKADLGVAKAATSDSAVAGGDLTYTITVTNNGPSEASGAMVIDTLPAGVSFDVESSSPGCTESPPGTVTCMLGDLAADAETIVTIAVTVDSSAMEPLVNSVRVESSSIDDNGENDMASTTTEIIKEADLEIGKSDSPDPVAVAQALTYTVTVTNHGPSDASNVTVTDTLPGGVTFDDASSSPGCTEETSGTVECTAPSVAANTSAMFMIVVRVGSETTGTLLNTASVQGDETDPNHGNNDATASTTVTDVADLAVSKSDTPDPVAAGAMLIYTVTVTNHGPSEASNVTVTDTLPAGVTFDDGGSSAECALSDSQVRCTIGSLMVHSSIDRMIAVTVNSNTTGMLSNTVSVQSDTADDNPSNNTATEPTEVITQADLGVTKSDNPDPVVAGNMLTYTLTVTNHGPSDSSGSTVTDTLPAGVTFDAGGSSMGCALSDGQVSCPIGSLTLNDSTESTNILIALRVNPDTMGTLTNMAAVEGNEPDPDPENNTVSEPTEVIKRADLGVTKADSPDPVVAGAMLTYTLTVTNHGPSDSSGSTVTDTLPDDVTFDAEGSSGACTEESPGSIACAVGSLGVGTNTRLDIVVAPTAAGMLINTADVSESNEEDPNDSNDSATETTEVLGNLELDDQTATTIGETVTFTVTVNNAPNLVDAMGFDITFDPNVLDFDATDADGDLVADDATPGPLVDNWSFFGVSEPEPGRIRVAGSTVINAIQAGESGILVQLTFTVAAAGTIPLNIAALFDDMTTFVPGSGQFTFIGPGGLSAVVRNQVDAGGVQPASVAMGDLNLDGSPDLAVANFQSRTVAVLLGDGTGGFRLAATYVMEGNPASIVADDLNDDGLPDLAFIVHPDTISVLSGDGTGNFGQLTSYRVSDSPQALAVDDVNGDGLADLAVAVADADSVAILLGTGQGAFAPAVHFPAGTQPLALALGDLNADGHLDLAVANADANSVSVLLGTGQGTFAPAVHFPVEAGPIAIAVGDVDANGTDDLAVANADANSVSVLLNYP